MNWWRLQSVLWPWYVAASYFYSQNSYFGWNKWPQSDAEVISDGFAALLISIAVIQSRFR